MTEAEAVSLWREYTGESDTTTPISDANVTARYLKPAAQDLNRRVGYFYADQTVTIVNGTQEYALDVDTLQIVFVELGTELLLPTDLDELKEQEPGWRQTPAGIPTHYFIYGLKIGFWPKPDAAAAALTCTVRAIETPTISTTPGFDLLATQDHAIPVARAAQLWFESHGQDADFARAQRFEKLFETEAAGIKTFYAQRRTQRGPQG